MISWMKELAHHYEKARTNHPDDNLMIIFDIDNTIIDMREMIAYVLRAYDRGHGTQHFKGLTAADLTINENQVDAFLAGRDIDPDEQLSIMEWYLEKRWDSEGILRSHRPYSGVMEVLRWFQMQPNTYVGLNTGRPESIRSDTLRSLNALGEAYKVMFRDDLLYMNPGTWEDDVTGSKADGIRVFEKAGFRSFAVVDNEPDNLDAIAAIDTDSAILLLHADTIFDSSRSKLPGSSVSGSDYDLTELISEKALPEHVQFVWHGVNDEANLRQFLASDVQWGECDVRLDPHGPTPVLRHDGFTERPLEAREDVLCLQDVLPRFIEAGKSIKIDIKETGRLVDEVIRMLGEFGIEESRLWINGNVVELGGDVFRRLATRFPKATIQCNVGHLSPLLRVAPAAARVKFEALHALGINRFSVAWGTRQLGDVLDQLDEWGYDVNIYNVPDLQSFLKAVLLHPKSVTSDFNFPKWHLYGRGAGKDLRHHTYALGLWS